MKQQLCLSLNNSLSILMIAYCRHVRYSCCHILNVVHETVPNCSIILSEDYITAKNSYWVGIVQFFDRRKNIDGWYITNSQYKIF